MSQPAEQPAESSSWLESHWLYVAVPKKIMIENHRLGLTLRLLQIAVVVWLFEVYSSDRKWMMEETVPESFQAYWANPGSESHTEQKEKDRFQAFCSDPTSFNYHYSEDYVYTASGCADLIRGEEYIKGENSMYVPTYFQDTWTHQTSGENCIEMKRCCGTLSDHEACDKVTWQKFGKYEDMPEKSLSGQPLCECRASRSYFVRGVSGLNVTFVPSYLIKQTEETGTTKRREDNILVVIHTAESQKEQADSSQGSSWGSLLALGGSQSAAPAASVPAPPAASPVQAGTLDRSRSRRGAHTTSVEVDSTGSVRGLLETDDISEQVATPEPAAEEVQQRLPRTQVRREPKRARHPPKRWTPFGSLLEGWSRRTGKPGFAQRGGQDDLATYFEPGEIVGMSLEDWLRHADLMGMGPMSDVRSNTDSVLDAENSNVRRNANQDSKQLYPTFRTTGLELTLDMSFENEAVHKRRDHKGTVLNIKVLARPDWESLPVVHNILPLEPMSGNAIAVKRYYYGVRLRFVSAGRFASVSYPAMIAAVSSFILYLQLPGMLVAAVAIYLCGVPSDFYYEAANERMGLKTIASNYIARLLQAYSCFKGNRPDSEKGARDSLHEEHFTRERLTSEVKALAQSEQPDFEPKITSQLADLMLEEHDDDKKGYLSAEDLTQATLDCDFATLKSIGDLICRDRKKYLFEQIFVPDTGVNDERAVAQRARKAQLVAERQRQRMLELQQEQEEAQLLLMEQEEAAAAEAEEFSHDGADAAQAAELDPAAHSSAAPADGGPGDMAPRARGSKGNMPPPDAAA